MPAATIRSAPSGSCVDTDYYETFNRDNVTLVDLRERRRSRRSRRRVSAPPDAEYDARRIVFATGFDAMTGPLLNDRHPRPRRPRAEGEVGGRAAHLPGHRLAGFPNLFMITGPGSPSVLSNMVVSIEQHVDWIADCLALSARRTSSTRIEADAATPRTTGSSTSTRSAHTTLYPRANSWYMGANIPGKPRVFMPYVGGVGAYRQKCDEIAARGIRGFSLTPPA